MSVLNRFGLGRGSGLPKNATYRITQEGREKLQFSAYTAQTRVLTALETCGTSNRDEIANASGLSRSRVEKEIQNMLQHTPYIQMTNRVGGTSVGGGQMDSMDGDG